MRLHDDLRQVWWFDDQRTVFGLLPGVLCLEMRELRSGSGYDHHEESSEANCRGIGLSLVTL